MSTKADILSMACDLFSKHGYHGTTMRELASALDLKTGSLYEHITSKEEVLWEIVNRVADLFLAHAEAVPQDIALEEQLKLLVRGHLEITAKELNSSTVFFHEWKFLKPELRDKIRERRNDYEIYFWVIIEEGVEQGLFQVEDARVATLFILSALNWTYQWFDPGGYLTIERLADYYITFILRVLKGGQGSY